MKKFLLFFFLASCVHNSNGQPALSNTPATQYLPFDFAFSQKDKTRTADYSVNYFNGQPNITIPLYTVREGDIEIPIELRYHADGIKVGENSGYVGLGWSLSFGGSLSRTVKDVRDEQKTFFLPNLDTFVLNAPVVQLVGAYTLLDMDYSLNDNEYDVFNYSFPGGSGEFVLRYTPWHTQHFEPVLTPYKPYKLNWPSSSNSSSQYSQDFSWFDIYDEKGNRYRFGKSIDNSQTVGSPLPGEGSFRIPLTDVVSGSNPNHKIKFIYNYGTVPYYITTNKYLSGRYLYEDDFDYLQSYVSCDSWELDGGGNPSLKPFLRKFQDYLENPYITNDGGGHCGYFEDGYSETQHYGFNFNTGNSPDRLLPIPGEIQFSEGYVKIVQGATNHMVDRIEIYNLNNELIKKISFDIGQIVTTDNIYKCLKGIKNLNPVNNTVLSEYKLEYDLSNGAFPSGNDATAIDYWGYYNGKNFNQNLIPKLSMLPPYNPYYIKLAPASFWYVDPGLADRRPDENYLKTYTLKKIIYPEGGYSLFDYELNKTATDTGGGLRIKNIQNFDAGNLAFQKSLSYSTAMMDAKPEQEQFCFSKKMYLVSNWNPFSVLPDNHEDPFRRTTFTPFASVDLAPKGSSVVYPQVVEYNGTATNNTGASTYTYDYEPTTYGTYKFGHSYDVASVSGLPTKFVASEKPWNSGNLISKTAGNVQENYEYEEVLHDTAYDVVLNRFAIPYFNCNPVSYGPNDFDLHRFFAGDPVFDVAQNYHIAGEKRLRKETKIYAGQNGINLVTQTRYDYASDLYDQITNVTTGNSKGDSIKISKTYAWNTTSTDPVYTTMVSRNMIAQEIQEDKSLNNNAVASSKTDYKDWGNGIILPEKVREKEANGNWIEKVRYDLRDNKGNPLQITANSGSTIAFTYDYMQQLANSVTQNAGYNEIGYTSFEGTYAAGNDVNLGNWQIANLNAITNTDGFTGSHCLNLSQSGGWSDSSHHFIAGKQYIVSFWKKGAGSFGFGAGASISFITGATINGWTYYEGLFTGDGVPSHNLAFWYNNNSFSVYIDELRFYPANAYMETGTYKPLIGMTSHCDSRNMVTYYEYDNYGRQVLIKDMNGNILKKTDYATQQSE